MLKEGLEATNLTILDRVLGLALGILEGFVVVGLFIVVLKIQPLFNVTGLLASSLYVKLLGPLIEPAIGTALSPLFKEDKLPKPLSNLKGH